MRNPVRWWLNLHHWVGERAENQYDFYRCAACKGIVTWKHIRTRGECPCGSAKISPTRPRLLERISLLLLPWTV